MVKLVIGAQIEMNRNSVFVPLADGRGEVLTLQIVSWISTIVLRLFCTRAEQQGLAKTILAALRLVWRGEVNGGLEVEMSHDNGLQQPL